MNKLELPARILFDTVFLLLRSLAKEQSQKKDLSEGFLSISKGQILFVVAEQTARCGCGIKLKQIAAQTRQSMSTVSETVDFLEKCSHGSTNQNESFHAKNARVTPKDKSFGISFKALSIVPVAEKGQKLIG